MPTMYALLPDYTLLGELQRITTPSNYMLEFILDGLGRYVMVPSSNRYLPQFSYLSDKFDLMTEIEWVPVPPEEEQ